MKLTKEMEALIEADNMAARQTRWELVGICEMDTARLLLSDPCYCLDDPSGPRGEQEIADYRVFTPDTSEVLAIPFRRGHMGAGIMFHSPHGDGAVEVWAKLDAKNRVRSVFFSFDGEKPEGE